MRKALIIEDTPELADFVAGVFRHLRFDVRLAEDIADAISALESNGPYEAAFVNMSEPGWTDTTGLMKDIARRCPKVKIIICSTRLGSLRELPPCVYLAKPLRGKTLLSVLVQTFG